MSAAILAPAALLCVWFDGAFYLALVVLTAAGVLYEWGVMCRWRPLPLLLGSLYALLAAFSLLLVRAVAGPEFTIFLFAIVWACDIGAYAAGRWFGGARLAPSISPGKTWSGAAGGLVVAVVLGGLIAGFSSLVLLLSALLAIASQLGDLGESAVKRHYGVKDSGRLIPGHGGLLDRLDGLMAASIVAGLMLVAGRSGA